MMNMIKHCLLITVLSFGLAAAHSAESPRIVFMIGEDEYHTWETLPEFAEKDLRPMGYRITIVNADAANPNDFPGLIPALEVADLLFLSVRRRTPLREQLDAVRAYLDAGKPLAGIRTASHAFALPPKRKLTDAMCAVWPEFDPQVLGGNYTGHHGTKFLPTITFAPGAETHPVLRGVSFKSFVSSASLYKVSPLDKDAVPLLIGTIPDKPVEPVAWTHLYGSRQARVFYTSLGHPDDFKNPDYRRLLIQGVMWALDR